MVLYLLWIHKNLFPSYWPWNKLILLSRDAGKILGLQALTLSGKAGAIMETRFMSAGLEKVFISNPSVFWQYIIVHILLANRAFCIIVTYSILISRVLCKQELMSPLQQRSLSSLLTLARNMNTVKCIANLIISTTWPHLNTPTFALYSYLSQHNGREREVDIKNWGAKLRTSHTTILFSTSAQARDY